MKTRMTFALAAGVAAMWTLGADEAAAQARPDLVVNVERSQILALSCRTNEPLAIIRVAIDNIGDGPAGRSGSRGGIDAIAGVAAEHAPYTYAQVDSASNIDPGEISTEVITLGDNIVKAGRIGDVIGGVAQNTNVVSTARTLVEQRRLPEALRRELQSRLQTGGFYNGRIDGVFGPGTEGAIRAFQRASGDAETGVLTVAQIDDLLRGGPPRSSFLNRTGQSQQVRFIVIVDPANAITESDESNNIWITPPQTLNNC